jgi:hypothetical protein
MIRSALIAMLALAALSCGRVDARSDDCGANEIFSSTYSMGVNDDSIGSLEVAQKILIPGTSGTRRYTRIYLPLYLGGAVFAGGTMTLSVYDDNDVAGEPGTTLRQSSTVQLNTLASTDPVLVAFDFASPATLTAGEVHWLVLSATYVHTATNVVRWAGDDLARGGTDTYSGGTAKYESVLPTESWTDTNIGGGRALGFQTECETSG